jgi:hypothetical protein
MRRQRQYPRHLDLRRVWRSMLERCGNQDNSHWGSYGGRGITVCARWRSFAAFRDDMGPKPSPTHSIDRINNDGNYEPGNCRWATRADQNRNKRNSRRLAFNGEVQTVAEWAVHLGMSRQALSYRLNHGWTLQRIFTEPLETTKSKASEASPIKP